eukprot:tig00021493_g21898.t1
MRSVVVMRSATEALEPPAARACAILRLQLRLVALVALALWGGSAPAALGQAAAPSCSKPLCRTGVGPASRWSPPASTFRRVSAASPPSAPLPPLTNASRLLQTGVAYAGSAVTSAFIAGWMQFLALDIAEWATNATDDPLVYAYEACDAAGRCSLRNGSIPAPLTAGGALVNGATNRIDGGPVYGATPARAAAVRAFSGGLLKEEGSAGPPPNELGLPMGGPPERARRQRLTGSPEGNASPALLGVISTLVREHNRVARALLAENPAWDDEALFQEARVRVVAVIQRVTVLEVLPVVLGAPLTTYKYNASGEARVPLEFAAAAALVHRTLLPRAYARVDASGAVAAEGPLSAYDAYYTAAFLEGSAEGMPGLVRGLASTYSSRADLHYADFLRAGLWPLPDAGTEDLARGRLAGLPRYGQARAGFGLPVPSSWDKVASGAALLEALQAAYPSPADADLLVGLLAEKEQAGGVVGPLAAAIILETIKTVRDTDPYWFDTLAAPVQNEVRARRFTDTVESAWAPFIKSLPRSVFIATPPPWQQNDFSQDLSALANATSPAPGNATSPASNATASASATNATAASHVYAASARLNDVLSIRWSMLVATREIEVAVTCACDGWVGMGFGSSMADADVVWMRHNASGSPLAVDAKAIGFRGPATDGRQDVTLVEASRSPGTQTFRWRRAWSTGDAAQDKPIEPGRQRERR